MNKKLLILTYRYPPFGGIGAVRMTCITKYLPQYGWDPFVYTSDWNQENCRQYDPDFAIDVLPRVVHRAKIIPATQAPVNESVQSNRSGLSKKFVRLFQSGRELQNQRNWVREGKRVLPGIFQKHSGFDAILATYPTTPALRLGNWASRRFGVPWLVDFRDIIEEFSTRSLWFWQRHERRLVQSSASMITVAEPLAEMLRQRNSQTVHVIPNGFDLEPTPRQSSSEKQPQRQFEIVFTGQIYPVGHQARESPAILFEALDLLHQHGKINLDDFRIRMIGSSVSRVRSHFCGRASEACVTIEEWMPRAEIHDVQRNATLLLSLGSRTMNGIMTGKIFEYLNSGRPILSIPRDTEAIGQVLSATHAGQTAGSASEVADYIDRLYCEWKVKRCLPDIPHSDIVDQYHWRNQTGRFAELLDDAL